MCFVCKLTNDSFKSVLHPKSLEELINIDSSNKSQSINNASDLTREYGDFKPTSIIFNSSNTFEGFNDLPSNEYIHGLLAGSRWDNISSDSAKVTTDLKYYLFDNETVSFEDDSYQTVEISPEELNAINYSFESFSNIADITFTKTNTANEAHIAWLLFDNVESLDDYAGVAYLPTTGSEEAGYIAINASVYSNQNLGSTREIKNNSLNRGSYEYITFPHELGHALGLKHPHDDEIVNINDQKFTYYTFPGVNPGGENEGGFNDLNASPWTVMTYNDLTSGNQYSPTSTDPAGGFLLGLGAFDIASIQYIYGPNINFNKEDNKYILDSNLNGYQCIWDAGGEDVIDASSSSSSVNIDLRNATLQNEPGGGGFVSKVKNSFKGFTIAYNSTGSCVIENAIGSTNNDNLIGNAFNNTISGGAGDDIIIGGNGSDTLNGGSGNDSIYGGSDNDLIEGGIGNDSIYGEDGSDIVAFNGNFADYNFILNSKTGSIRILDSNLTRDGADSLNKIESFKFNDQIYSLSDVLAKTGFESLDYIASYGDLINAFGTNTSLALSHYVNYGQSEGRSPDTFNAWGYLVKYDDLVNAFASDVNSAIQHYINHGYVEGRSSGDFEVFNYIASHNDLINAFGSNSDLAGAHYLNHGKSEGRSIDNFDEWQYLASHEDLLIAFGNDSITGIKHYLNNGYAEGRSTDNFDEWGYIASNTDLIRAFGSDTSSAIQHYINYGYSEERSFDTFNASNYLSLHSDLRTAFGADLNAAKQHYVNHGFNEGRIF